MRDYRIISFIATVSVLMNITCSEDENLPSHPMAGTYSLIQYSSFKTAVSNFDTLAVPLYPNSGTDTNFINRKSIIFADSNIYIVGTGTTVEGKIILKSDGSASLSGRLPTNIGLPCYPTTIIGPFASSGSWEVLEDDSTFILNLANDLLDITGGYSYNDLAGILNVFYTAIDTSDTLGIDSLRYNGEYIDIYKLCLTTTSTTERSFTFLKD